MPDNWIRQWFLFWARPTRREPQGAGAALRQRERTSALRQRARGAPALTAPPRAERAEGTRQHATQPGATPPRPPLARKYPRRRIRLLQPPPQVRSRGARAAAWGAVCSGLALPQRHGPPRTAAPPLRRRLRGARSRSSAPRGGGGSKLRRGAAARAARDRPSPPAMPLARGRRSKVQGPRSKVEGRRSKVQGPRSKVRGPGSEVQGPMCGTGS